MKISQKCRYAIRGVFELARQGAGKRPVSATKVALAQHIPRRFMEMIFNELKHARIIKSIRGTQGGYLLNRKPAKISLGEIMRLAEGPLDLVECVSAKETCPFMGACAFMETWEEAARAVANVFDHTTIQDCLDREAAISSTASAVTRKKTRRSPVTRRRSAQA